MRALYDLAAPAKLNLFLHVVGRRADGYHLLQSAFVLIDWADTLHLEVRADGRLQRHDLAAALPADDLCLRAARALQQAAGCALGADISIDKQLPWGAGLGGGSSDAATTLLGLNRLWGLRWPRQRLLELAATLGADVPFFVGGRNAFVEGIGERLTPLALPRAWYAVAKPAASLATAAIFACPLLKRDGAAAILAGFLADASPAGAPSGDGLDRIVQGFGRNDLQPAAEQLCDEVAQAAAWLQARYGNSRMTGSGSAVFARAGTGDQPVATFPAASLPPGWVGRMCRSLDQHPLADWAG
ncbi:MAG: 4-(cytidine 5'-diphospho)-2-C-methyl-D-erythritol kinase [Proteobacteria bacterium]|nr:4-(cytidine 5'-diphospho)-2-C-methyl-D-erythritol kinase [Pseudomonadota bacterium]